MGNRAKRACDRKTWTGKQHMEKVDMYVNVIEKPV